MPLAHPNRAPRRSLRLSKEGFNARDVGSSFWPSVSFPCVTEARCAAVYITTGDPRALTVAGKSDADCMLGLLRAPPLPPSSLSVVGAPSFSPRQKDEAEEDENEKGLGFFRPTLAAVERPWLRCEIVKLVGDLA